MTTDRRLPLLGVALIALALICLLPPISTYARSDAPGIGNLGLALHLGCNILLPGVLGIFALATCRLEVNAAALVRLALAALLAYEFSSMSWIFSGSSSVLKVFYPVSWLLIGVAAPLCWGAALGRREKHGRIFSGLILLGFLVQFAVRLRSFSLYGIFEARTSSFQASAGALAYVLLAVQDVLLVWAAIESMRTAPDADRIHGLMLRWVVLAPFSTLLFNVGFQTLDTIGRIRYDLWRGGLFVSVTSTAAFALGRSYRMREA